MNWIKGKGFLALGLVCLLLTGCATTNQPLASQVHCDADELRVGDLVNVTSADVIAPQPDQRTRIKADGTINLPLIGSVQAAGKKISDLEQEIQKAYVPRYYKQLTVSIKAEDRFYSVGGEVRLPGRLQYLGETTLLRAIQSAGDFTDYANRKKVQIIRANGEREIVNALKARQNPKKFDLPLCPGDAIHVPQSF